MSESDPVQVNTSVPAVPTEHRQKLRIGFALCSGAFALAVAYVLISLGAAQLASSSDTHFSETHDSKLELAGNLAGTAVDALLIAGLACLYVSRNDQRWRLVSTVALALLGVDVAIVCFDAFGTDPAMLELTRDFGLTLNWVVLWVIAILAAEAAESIGRADIIYQTEVTGRLIIWGGVGWLAYLIWSFDPARLGKPVEESAPAEFSVMILIAAQILQLFAVGRTILFCGGLAAALSPTQEQDKTPPGHTA
jgi:hypothetical protein